MRGVASAEFRAAGVIMYFTYQPSGITPVTCGATWQSTPFAARALLPTAARGVEPGHPDAGSRLRPSDAFADVLDYACDLVAGYERELDERKGALQNGQVAVANAAGVDPDQNLTWTG